jgi:hypothetical protein
VRTATAAKLIVVTLGFELVFARAAAALPPGVDPFKDIPASLALGVGAADRIVSGSSGVAFPLELTLTPTPSLFTSGGLVLSHSGVDHGYLEIGVWFGVSVAGGAGYGAYDSAQGQGRKEGATVHLFVGVPIPFETDTIGKKKWLPYLEPYYRPSWGPWPGTVHEVGFMMKISYWFTDPIGKIGG